MADKEDLIRWFSEIKKEDSGLVGDKASYIGELHKNKFPMPPGFVLTDKFYEEFMNSTGLSGSINLMLDDLDIGNKEKLKETCTKIMQNIEKADFPKELQEKIIEAYDLLDVNQDIIKEASGGALSILKNSREPVFVALRTSLSREIKKTINSNKEYILNIKGYRNLIDNIKKIYVSLFTEQDVFNRLSNNIENKDFKISIIVQKMINADKSGIIYTRDDKQRNDDIQIRAIWGLGIGRKLGVKTDKHFVNREDLSITSSTIAIKEFAATRNSSGENCTVKLTAERGAQQALTNHEIKILAQMGLKLEEIMKKPQRVDFCISNGEISVLGSKDLNMKTNNKISGIEVAKGEFQQTIVQKDKPENKLSDQIKSSEDIEQVILKELSVSEYRPGAIREKDEDMPRLNDAILVEEQRDLDDESKIDLV